ncbi:hypothetical protein MTR67_035551 [Solanum verrucosum]|uniref:Uncharacterized protein n=1 Tax=Solanum verrucosum TaxID=315347 RepID=A0AAF0ZJZ6_SOLVR|nr:hypothetical protein MTR67_035551 [Solanum verrucosum]
MSHGVRVSYFSQDEGSLGDQQWFSSADHVQGIGSGRDREIGYTNFGHVFTHLLNNITLPDK